MWYTNPERFNNYGLRFLVRGFMDGQTDIAGNFHLAHIKYEPDELGKEIRKDVKVFYVGPSFPEKDVRFSWRGSYVLIKSDAHSLIGAADLSPTPGILTSRPEVVENLFEVIAVRNLKLSSQDPKMRVNGVEYVFPIDKIKPLVDKHPDNKGLALCLHLDKYQRDYAELLINNGDSFKCLPIPYRKRNESFKHKSKVQLKKSAERREENQRIEIRYDEFNASKNYAKAEKYLGDLWLSSTHLFDGANGRTILLSGSLDTIIAKSGGRVPLTHYEGGVKKKFYVGKRHSKRKVSITWRGPYVKLNSRNGVFMQAYERNDYGFEITGTRSLNELDEAVHIRNLDSLTQPNITMNNIKYKFLAHELREQIDGLTPIQMALMGHIFKDPSQSEFYFLVKTNDTHKIFPIRTVTYTEKRKTVVPN